jgi:hypothetical protein
MPNPYNPDNHERPMDENYLAIQTTAAPVAPVPEPTKVTAVQSKVEAVANLTFKAYERASTLVLTPEESKALQEPFPDSDFRTGAAGKDNLIYLEHAALRDRLNKVLGIGQWSIIPRSRWAVDGVSGNGKAMSTVYVEAMLIVRGAYVSEAVGDMVYYPDSAAQNYGDAVEGAKTAALRRCTKEFGVGLQAWSKDWTEGWWHRRNTPRTQLPVNTPPPVVAVKLSPKPKAAPVAPQAPAAAPVNPPATPVSSPAKEIEQVKAEWRELGAVPCHVAKKDGPNYKKTLREIEGQHLHWLACDWEPKPDGLGVLSERDVKLKEAAILYRKWVHSVKLTAMTEGEVVP